MNGENRRDDRVSFACGKLVENIVLSVQRASGISSRAAEERKFAIFGSHLKRQPQNEIEAPRNPPELENNNTNST